MLYVGPMQNRAEQKSDVQLLLKHHRIIVGVTVGQATQTGKTYLNKTLSSFSGLSCRTIPYEAITMSY